MDGFTTGLRKGRARRKVVECWLTGLALSANSILSFAAGDFTPFATASYEYQSNPFLQSNGSPSRLAESADALVLLRAGMDAWISSSRQALVATSEVRRFDYRELTSLERTESQLAGTYRWSLTSLVSGSVEYRHEHRMVPFDELADTRELLMETEDTPTATLSLTSRTGWGLESRLRVRALDSPRPDAPQLNLHETAVHEAVRRTLKSTSAGLDVEHLSGSYGGATQLGARSYRQTTVQLAGERKIAGFSAFEGAIGYTRRDDAIGAGASAFTGLLGYQRALSSKTSLEARFTRAVNSYVTSAGSVLDTGLSLALTWRLTAKTQVSPAFSMMRSELSAQPFASGSSRRDLYRVLTLDIRYQVLDWLSLHPYARRAVRSSNSPAFGFDANAIGLELAFKESQ